MRGILAGAGAVGLTGALLMNRPLLLPLEPSWTRGVGAGALLGTAGSLGGFLLLLRNLKASHARFLAALLGGMMARWVLFGAAVAAVALGGAFPVWALLAGLIPSYLGFQAVEMWHLHRWQGTGAVVPGSGGDEAGG